MKSVKLMKETTSSKIYKRVKKIYLEKSGTIRCSIDPYHDGENWRRHRKSKCWKRFRQTQYKIKD